MGPGENTSWFLSHCQRCLCSPNYCFFLYSPRNLRHGGVCLFTNFAVALEELLSWGEIVCFGGGLSCFLLSNRSLNSWPAEDLFFFLVDQVSLASLNVINFVSSSVLHFTPMHGCLRKLEIFCVSAHSVTVFSDLRYYGFLFSPQSEKLLQTLQKSTLTVYCSV